MSESTFFKTIFIPDYSEMIAVAQASGRYHFTWAQRSIWAGLILIYAAMIFAIFRYDRVFIDWAEPVLGPVLSPWMPIIAAIALGAFYTWFVCYFLACRLSGRWLEKRSPSRPVSLSADADYISWYSDESGLWLKWTAIERIYVTPIAIAFLVGGMSHYVPIRSFANAREMRDFLRDALQRIPDAARRRSKEDLAVREAIA